jgi:2-polyprenyl-3-methyl-5-hydroxy-6-metoxy-1,4-benzoquinol methylase
MKLLSENELVWSWVVANSKMNRKRNASGVNSYEKELKIKPGVFLEEYIRQFGNVTWLDICCGEGKALIQAAEYLATKGLQDKATLKGIDLVAAFQPIPPSITCVDLDVKSIVDWDSTEQYDLITSVHGIHYIGDKLKVLSAILGRLSEEGLFIANLDLNNIHFINGDADKHLKNIFKQNNVQYNSRTRLITCKGPRHLEFNVTYKGANDEVGPNYTGQDSVCSVYEVL